jgi:hypothetical protein
MHTLRLPDASFILPFAVLIASLLMLATPARNNEIMALKASGLSFYHLLLKLRRPPCWSACFIRGQRSGGPARRVSQEWDGRPGRPSGKGGG